MAEHERRVAGHIDERREVLDLAIDRVGWRIRAVAAAAAVVGDDRQLIGQARGEVGDRPPVGQRAVDDDE